MGIRWSTVTSIWPGQTPKNAASYLRIDRGSWLTPGRPVGGSGRQSQLHGSYTDDLAVNQWSTLGYIVGRPTDSDEQLPDPTWTSNRFIRHSVARGSAVTLREFAAPQP